MPYDARNIVVSGCTVIFNGQPVGWTEDPVVITSTHEDLVINKVQQKAGVVARKRVNYDITIKMNLIENTLENLKLIFALNSNIQQLPTKRILTGDMSGELPTGELVIYGTGVNGVARTFRFYKVVQQEAGEVSYDARGYTKVALTFQVLWHPNYDDLFVIEEEIITPSGVESN